MSDENRSPTFFDWLGLRDAPDYTKARVLGQFAGVVLKLTAFFFGILFFLSLAAAFALVWGVASTDTPTASLGLGALLVALLGAPFLIWRTLVAQNTLDTARKEAALKEEALFNDKINAAAKDLAARRQVTRVAVQDKKEIILTEWEDDLVTRAAAIDLLEGLAKERPDAAPRIARQLSIYVRELSRQYPPKEPPNDATPVVLQRWASDLSPVRPDIEKAAQTLGRLQKIKTASLSSTDIDLRGANLQGCDLYKLRFEKAILENASLQGANLRRSNLTGANLFLAKMQGALLSEAEMQGANLFGAEFQGTELVGALLQGADLSCAELQGTNLLVAQLQGAKLNSITLSIETNLNGTSLHGAATMLVHGTTLEKLKPCWPDIIGIFSPLPEGAPDHWIEDAEIAPYSEKLDSIWRTWAATLTPPVTIAPDYRDKDPT